MTKSVLNLAIVILVLASSSAETEKSITAENGQRFYMEIEGTFSWYEAIDKCKELNMSLISMDSDTKTQEVINWMQTVFGTVRENLWIGGHDHNVSRHFEWISTGEAFSYTNWYSDQPNNAAHHCVFMWTAKSLKWFDLNCNYKNRFVCEENPLQKVTKTEIVLLKESMANQTTLLNVKNEVMDSLKKEFEKFQKQSLENMKQNQEEIIILQKSSEQQMVQLNQTQKELNALKAQIAKENEIKQLLKDMPINQLQHQNQIIDSVTNNGELNKSEAIKSTGTQVSSNPFTAQHKQTY